MELDPHNEVMAVSESQVTARRNLRVQRSDLTNRWTINEKTWEDVLNSGYTDTIAKVPRGNAVELWRIENRSGGWFHPVHIHLVDFKIVRRSGGVGRVFPYEQGPKDVVYVGESETVDLLVKFAPSPGSSGGHYMVHCHNLPHEDHDMMTQFSVGEPDIASSAHHPMSAPAVADPTYEGGTTALPTSAPTATSTATATSSPTSTSTSTATTAPTSTSTTTSAPTVTPSPTTTARSRRRKPPRNKT